MVSFLLPYVFSISPYIRYALGIGSCAMFSFLQKGILKWMI